MRSSFNFFQKKLKSVDNYSPKKSTNNDQSMLNSIENSFRLENKQVKKKPLIDKEISTLSHLKSNIKKLDSITKQKKDSFIRVSSFKKSAKKRSVESLFLERQNKRNSNQNPVMLLKNHSIRRSNKKVHYSSNNGSINYSNFKMESNEFLSSIDSVKSKKKRFLELKKPRVDFYNDKMGKTPKNIGYNNFFYKNYIKDYFKNNSGDKRPESSKAIVESKFNYYNNNLQMLKINQKIQNEIDSMELKKKVNLMRKTIIQIQSSKDLKDIIEEENGFQIEENNKKERFSIAKNETEDNKEDKEESNACLKNKSNLNEEEKITIKDKYRKLKRKKEIYDSLSDEEYEDENDIGYYISPNSCFIKIFDYIVFISSMIYFIFVPFFFSNNSILQDNKTIILLLMLIDLIYILDLIINCFRAYHNFDENLVKKSKSIFLHYLKGWFFFDFIQCIPFLTLFKSFEKVCFKNNYELCSFEGSEYNKISPTLYFMILVKIVKVYKIFNENNSISELGEFITRNEIIDNYGSFILSMFFSICTLNLCSCLFIFIGKNSYPGWIMKINVHDEPYIDIYISSIYFILVTITTVGYGDITGDSYAEIIYQMFLLIIGTIAYSFVISYISNYIVKINQKSMTFEKNLNILQEIRLNNPNLKNSIYLEVLKNLHNEQLYEKKDKSLLFDCLPYTLKNKLIMEMYKPFIENFIFFKDNENSDFIVKVVTSLKPLLSFKGDILIQEGDFIKEIFFVKKGVLSLDITIDRDNPQKSINKYLDIAEDGRINISYIVPSIVSSNKRSSIFNLDEHFNVFLLKTRKEEEIIVEENVNVQEIKIVEIRKNEHFGDALMFLNERCPLIVRVRTKLAELLVLRKMEAIEIYSVYPNIWKRINKKSLFNMEQIKLKIKKELFFVSRKYGQTKERKILKNSKSLQQYLNIDLRLKNNNIKAKKNKKNKASKNKQNEKNKEKIKITSNKNNNSSNNKRNNRKSNNSNNNKSNNSSNNSSKINNNSNRNTKENESQKNNSSKGDIKNNESFNDNNKETNQESPKKYPTIRIIDISNESNQENKNSENITSDKDNSNKLENGKDEKKEELDKKMTKNNNENIDSNPLISKTNKNNNDKVEFNPKDIKDKFRNRLSVVNFHVDKQSINNSIISNYPSIYTKNTKNFRISTINEHEKILFNSFSNLTTSNEKSFQLNSSYENLNEITKNQYINDNSLQSKTKQFLYNECSITNPDFEPKNNLLLTKDPLNGQIIISKNTIGNNKDFDIDEDKRSVNSLDLTKLKSNRSHKNSNGIKDSTLEKNKKENNIERFKTKRHNSFKSNGRILKTNINDTPNLNKIKSPKKRREIGVNLKLDIISKNINGASQNINNPEQFYMDFFNDLMKKKTFVVNKSNKVNNKSLNENEKIKNTKIMDSVVSFHDQRRKSKLNIKSVKKIETLNQQ